MGERKPGFVAERLDWLFRNKRREDGREYTYDEVAMATGLAKSYVWQMRFGGVKNPGRNALAALSKFFGVHPGFWFTDFFEELEETKELQASSSQENLEKKRPTV